MLDIVIRRGAKARPHFTLPLTETSRSSAPRLSFCATLASPSVAHRSLRGVTA